MKPGKHLARTEFRRKPPRAAVSARRKALPRQSAKRKAQNPERDALVERVKDRDGHRCTAPSILAAHGLDDPLPACSGRLEVHELIRRSQWRLGYLVDDNCRTVCASHHRWATLNPADAVEGGLSLRSTDRPTTPQENP